MDPILSEVYSTVLPAVPYVVGAYVGIVVVLFVYVFMIARKARRTHEDLEALAQALKEREPLG